MLTDSLPPKRSLKTEFMDDLKQGTLSPLLQWVQKDPSLDLQIRQDAINLYYRGGSLLKVIQDGNGYRCEFNDGYDAGVAALEGKLGFVMPRPHVPGRFNAKKNVLDWITKVLPYQKLQMDVHAKTGGERETQQQIVQVNNRGRQANGTDWYIGDLEFAVPGQKLGMVRKSVIKVDMLALHWPSTGSKRKSTKDLEWALVELKTGNKAIDGKTGLAKHLADMSALRCNATWLGTMREQVRDAINQRIELGLINDLKHPVGSISDKPPLMIFMLADVDPATSQFDAWLGELAKEPKELQDSVRFFVAHLMGYALHDQYLLTVDEAHRYLNQCWKRR